LAIIGFSSSHCINSDNPINEGYKLAQPIEFLHDIHVSKGIDCKYCHNSANDRKSKGIPAANICLKCHKEEKGKK
jgi:hypothetical protein